MEFFRTFEMDSTQCEIKISSKRATLLLTSLCMPLVQSSLYILS